VGTYVGSAVLLDENEEQIACAEVSLASINVSDGTWQGYVHGVDAGLLDGREITVALPGGTKGHARVIVDLTGSSPIIRLKGVGPGLL
jgi:hypothetical protein